MRRRTQWAEFFLMMFGAFCILLLVNYVVLFIMHRHDKGGWSYIHDIYQEFSIDGQQYSLSEEGKRTIDALHGFAFWMDENGDVVWKYQMPEEIPVHYSVMDVASFSRWYLEEYPVFIQTTDRGIFVLGQPKDTVWKYSLKYDMGVINSLLKGVPFIVISDILLLIIVPFFLSRRISKRKEIERTEWIAGISHDIRTPLSLVLGKAVRIRETSKEELIQREADVIEKQALRMKQLVANLNTENKLTYGAGKWKQDHVCLASCIREIVCEKMNQDEDGLFDFSFEIEEKLENYMVLVDEGLLNRMIENLINNAILHNPEGCEIQIEMLSAKKGKIEFIIKDNGTGTTKEKLIQLNKKISKESLPEHGLGLRVVKQIASYYHWKIQFFGQAEKGFGCRISM